MPLAFGSLILLIFLLSLQITVITAFHRPIVEIELPALPADYNSSKLPLGNPQVRNFQNESNDVIGERLRINSKPPLEYMLNNEGNTFNAAPDKGT